MRDQDRNEAERLNRLWDASLGSDRSLAADGQAEFADAISALHAADDAPEPDLAFLARLRREVLATDKPASARVPASTQTLGLVWPAPVTLPRRAVVRFAIAAIAAALLVAALSGGGRWLSGTGPAPMVASAMASTEPAHPTVAATSIGVVLRPGSAGFEATAARVAGATATAAPSGVTDALDSLPAVNPVFVAGR